MAEREPKGGWPCVKREAHGPHPVVEATGPTDCEYVECPGVDAHPNTSIGGAHDGKPAMYGDIDVSALTGGDPA